MTIAVYTAFVCQVLHAANAPRSEAAMTNERPRLNHQASASAAISAA
jgi:hypothetical protein